MRMRGFCVAALLVAAAFAAGALAAQPIVQYSLVKDIGQGQEARVGSYPRDFVASGGKIYFNAGTPAQGRELFVSDGVSAQLVADLAPNGASSFPRLLGQIGDTLIVSAYAGNVGSGTQPARRQIYALDPSDSSYVTLTQFPPVLPNDDGVLLEPFSRLASLGSHVVFQRHTDDSLWSTDGTPAGTQRLPVPSPATYADPGRLVCALQDRLLFLRSGAGALQLWASDGEAAGTGMIAEFPGQQNAIAAVRDGAGCYFLLTQNGPGWTLVQSNGSSAGTGVVEASSSTLATAMTAAGGAAFVMEWDPAASTTAARLRRAGQSAPIWSGADVCLEPFLAVVGGRLVFSAPSGDAQNACHVLVSDGTAGSVRTVQHDGAPLKLRFVDYYPLGDTLLVTHDAALTRIDPLAATATSSVTPFGLDLLRHDTAVLDNSIYFAMLGNEGTEPWRSDGTRNGSRLLADLAQMGASGVDGPSRAVARDGKLMFLDSNSALWRSDGTEAGTYPRMTPVYDSRHVIALLPFGDGFLFATHQPDQYQRVYRSDMDLAQEELLWTTQPGFNHAFLASADRVMFGCNNAVQQYCAYRDGDIAPSVIVTQSNLMRYIGSVGDALLFYNNEDLWRSDGTAPGTFLLRSGPFRNPQPRAVAHDGRLWFDGCSDFSSGCDLFSSDGSVAGTRAVAPIGHAISHIARFGNGIAFTGGGFVPQLWRSDGTAAGTRSIFTFDEGNVGGLGVVGDRIHVLVHQYVQPGYFVSDGTTAGTRLVPWAPGVSSGERDPVALDAQTALFVCYGDAIGLELCAVDREGQQMSVVADFYQGPMESRPYLLGHTGDALYYAINDGRLGRELWRLTGDRIFDDGLE